MSEVQRVLVLLRSVLPTGLIMEWPSDEEFERYEQVASWMPRPQAEASLDHVQPIAVATLRDDKDRYCVVKRNKSGSRYLSMKFTLVIGGHVDSGEASGGIQSLLIETLQRELEEEAGIASCDEIAPFVTLLDRTSVESSRHFAFVYRVTVDPKSVRIKAPEEFSQRTKFKVEFKPLDVIREQRLHLDPWSSLLLDHLTGSEGSFGPRRQYSLPLH